MGSQKAGSQNVRSPNAGGRAAGNPSVGNRNVGSRNVGNRNVGSRKLGDRWRTAVLLCWLALTLALPAPGQQLNELRMGDLRIPPPRGYVNDFADTLSRSQVDQLEQISRQIDRQTGAQVALVIVASLAGEPITEVRNRLFEAWGVGRADDRGLLILHALEERRIEVEAGYGLEGVLPDARVGAILDASVMPHFKAGDFFNGYREGLLALGRFLAEDPDARPGEDAYRSPARSGSAGGGRARSGERGFPWGMLLMAPVFIYLAIRHPRLLLLLLIFGGGGRRGGMSGGFGGGFGGFGGGGSGGGGAGRGY